MRVRLMALVVVVGALALPVRVTGAGPVELGAERRVLAVTLTGNLVPLWSRLAAVGVPAAWPSGALDEARDAHNGTVVVPPDVRTGVPVSQVTAFRWTGAGYTEIPVQVDERFPYFLANARSDFGLYSATDEEPTYAWDVESWKKTAGECSSAYPSGQRATPDPVPGPDDDDEVTFMASDAGSRAPVNAKAPAGTSKRQEIAVTDPLRPVPTTYVYLFLRPGGSSFTRTNGYVSYQRDANADEWIDRHSFKRADPEALGTSNGGYGPNIAGTVCRTAADEGYPQVADGVPRVSEDRFPRDGVTVRTPTYEWRATGRWMMRGMRVTKPGTSGVYGPDLVDRWKGRGYQQSPDSDISLVGFEDEQANWEANSALLGERTGPVRAIRETWGADSGTNVTKTETFYRDAVTYRYHLRVHPIPPDGIYQEWDHNAHVVTRYFNSIKPEGIAVDGIPDDLGNISSIGDTAAFFDVPDPTFVVPLAVLNWQQVSGAGDAGSLVYVNETKGHQSAENPAAFLFYNDDKCFDDGTGDDPVPRPFPGEAGSDPRVLSGYAQAAGKPYADVTCDEKQGAWGATGLHVLFTGDTDNAFQSKPVTEGDIQEWQFAVPTGAPVAVGEAYANTVRVPLVATVTPPVYVRIDLP